MALSNLPFWGLDVLAAQPRVPWDTLALRVAWALLTVLVVWALPRFRADLRGRVGWFLTGVLLPNVCLPLILWRLGGSSSPTFAWLCALPLLGMLLSMGVVYRSVVSAAASLVAALTLLALEGRPATLLAVWGLLIAGTGLVAVQAS